VPTEPIIWRSQQLLFGRVVRVADLPDQQFLRSADTGDTPPPHSTPEPPLTVALAAALMMTSCRVVVAWRDVPAVSVWLDIHSVKVELLQQLCVMSADFKIDGTMLDRARVLWSVASESVTVVVNIRHSLPSASACVPLYCCGICPIGLVYNRPTYTFYILLVHLLTLNWIRCLVYRIDVSVTVSCIVLMCPWRQFYIQLSCIVLMCPWQVYIQHLRNKQPDRGRKLVLGLKYKETHNFTKCFHSWSKFHETPLWIALWHELTVY